MTFSDAFAREKEVARSKLMLNTVGSRHVGRRRKDDAGLWDDVEKKE
jgi:hypothetical protein